MKFGEVGDGVHVFRLSNSWAVRQEVKLLYVDSRIPLGVEVFGIIKQRLNR